MNTLLTLQSDFQQYLLDDGAEHQPGAIAARVNQPQGMTAQARLAIYHRAYRSRLKQALCEAYDKTWTFTGDEMFAELADSYLAAHPSRHTNLRWYGADFAAHAAAKQPQYPFVAELAKLEWALGLAFDAEDAASLNTIDMGAIAPAAWGGLRFMLHPSVHMLEMGWNTVALWQAMQAGLELPDPQPCVMYWLIWRQDGQPHFRSLPPLEAEALRRIAGGACFGEVCEAAGEDAMLALAGYLQHWLAQGLLMK